MTSSLTPRTGALLLAWALGVYGVLGGLPMQPAHELHLSLAQHALSAFTSVWSTQWDLGHSFAGHPPLLHQMIALLARVPFVGLERSYAVIIALTPVVLTAAMGLFVERLESPRAGDVAAWLTAANPLGYLFLFPFGQAPFLVGTAFALVAGACWLSDTQGPRALVAGALFAAAAVCTHAAAVVALAVVAVMALTSRGATSRWRFGVLASGAAAVVIAALALKPFIELMWAAPAMPGSKLDGGNLVSTAVVWGMIAWSAVVSLGLGGRTGRLIGFVLIALAVLSVTHVMPGVAADKWLWLAAAFSATGWALVSTTSVPPTLNARAGLVAVLGLLLTSSMVLGGSNNDGYGHRNNALREARIALEQPGSESFRYLTLHVGAARFELARRVRAPSLDTGLPWVAASSLKGTGFVNLDELPLGDARGQAALDQVLAQADVLHLRWVITADSRATRLLQSRGFDLRSAWKGDLTLWERPSVTPLEPPVAPPNSTSWPWAVMPLSSTALGLALFSWRRKS